MAVPKVYQFYRPVLEIAAESNGIVARKTIITKLTTKLSLTRSDRREMLPTGRVTKVVSRTSWVLTVLKQYGMLDNPQLGQYQITQPGKDFLANHPGPSPIRNADFKNLGETEESATTTDLDPDEPEAITPEEQIYSSFQQHRDMLVEAVQQQVRDISSDAFERLSVELLSKIGYGEGSATQRSNDRGIDGILNQDPLGLEKVYIQAKRWNTAKVPEKPIRDFHTSLVAVGANKGVFITNSTFADDAKEVARNFTAQGKPIILIDGPKLAELMIRHGVGVRTINTYEVKDLDANYFAEA